MVNRGINFFLENAMLFEEIMLLFSFKQEKQVNSSDFEHCFRVIHILPHDFDDVKCCKRNEMDI